MKKSEDGIIALLFLVVCIQAYVVFFKNPAALVRQGQDDQNVQLQVSGHVPMEGEGRNDANLPPAAPSNLYVVNTPAPPGAGAMPGPPPAPAAGVPSQGAVQPPHDDPYRSSLLGVAALEKNPKLALTPAQAGAMLVAIRAAESAKNAVPSAQRSLLATLTTAQKAFIRGRVRDRNRRGLPPPPPEGMNGLLGKVLRILDRR